MVRLFELLIESWSTGIQNISPEQSNEIDKLESESNKLKKADRKVWFKNYVLSYYTGLLDDSPDPSRILDSLIHYFSYPNTDKFSLQGKKPLDYSTIFDELARLEQRYLAANKTELINHSIDYRDKKYKPQVLIDFGNGWAWYLLDTPSCDVESRSMGHCGNQGAHTGKILSLRQKSSVGKDNYKPFLTFILEDDGMLGEMKGSGNNKPNKKYHLYIKALLLHPLIEGISGGGYRPANNFSIFDFENQDDLIEISKVKKVWSLIFI